MQLNFRKKNILILGGSSEIGLALIEQLLEEGFNIWATYCNNSRAKLLYPNVSWLKLDLADKQLPQEIEILEVDYLIDLVHSDFESLISSADDNAVEKYYYSNVINRIILLNRLVNGMRRRRFGRLLFLSSTAVNRFNVGQAFYVSAKVALEKYYIGINSELRKKGISTLVLRPTYIDCGRFSQMNQDSVKSKIKPLKISEVVNNIIYFLSEQAISIAGSVIDIDKGGSNEK